MNWIERRFSSPGGAGLSPVRIRVPTTPAGLSSGGATSADFWNRSIDAWVALIIDGAQQPDCPTVPMPGGHGTLHTDGRAELCISYLFGIPPELRAHVVLHLLGAPAPASGEENGTREGYHAHAFRVAAAVWIEQHPVSVDGIDAGSRVVAGDRWMLVLAALYDVAGLGSRSGEHYRAAVRRCSGAAPIRSVALSSRSGFGEPGRQGAQRSTAAQWESAAQTLRRGGAEADRLLAGLVLRVVCSRLFVVLARRPKRTNAFFLQIGAWLRDALATPQTVAGPNACFGMALTAIEPMLRALLQTRPFGETGEIDCGEAYPAAFRPYRGGSGVRLARALRQIDHDLHPEVTRAWQLGALIADRVLDPIEIVCRSNRPQRRHGDWLDHMAYWNLESLMRQTVNQMSWGGADKLPSSSTRLQIQSFAREVKTSSQSEQLERTARAVHQAVESAPPRHGAPPANCGLCGSRVRDRGRATSLRD